MALGEVVEITVSREGKVSLKVKGVKGKKCLELTKDLEAKLGVVEERQLTGDYYQTQTVEEIKRRF